MQGCKTVHRALPGLGSVQAVHKFLTACFIDRNVAVAEEFLGEGFAIRSRGDRLITGAQFRVGLRLVSGSMTNFGFRSLTAFQNEDGSRVVAHWEALTTYGPMKDADAAQRQIVWSAISVWSIDLDGKLTRLWIHPQTWDAISFWISELRTWDAD